MKRTRLKLLLATGLTALGLNLTPQSASAITTSGVMPGNETWSGTVFLTGDVTVGPGVSLTILPGTQVQADSVDDQNGGLDPNRVELIVNGGSLTAIGNRTNTIVFTLGWGTPNRTGWYGLRIDTTNAAAVEHCVFEYAKAALSVSAGLSTLRNCSFQTNETAVVRNRPVAIENSQFVSCDVVGSPTPYDVSFANCIVTNCGNVLEAGGVKVGMTNCILTGNVIVITPIGAGGADLSMVGCTITNNGLNGSVVVYAGSIYASNCYFSGNRCNRGGVASEVPGTVIASLWGAVTMTDCTVENCLGNSPFAIATVQYGLGFTCNTLSLTRTKVNGRGIYGRYFIDACEITGGVGIQGCPGFVHNSVVRATDTGISCNLGSGAYADITGNTITQNGVGVAVSSSAVRVDGITNNAIFENNIYELKNQGSSAVYANGNFWGEPTTTELSNHVVNLTKIWDRRDDVNLGAVFIQNWLPTNPNQRPPQITSQPADLAVAAGATATFTVSATSASPLSYQWRKGTSSLLGQTNSFLSFTAQVSDAAANYNVIVSNSDGSVTSRWATLTVLIAPTITSQPTNLFLPPGTTAAFHVTANGSAPLGYQWQKEGVNLANVGRVSGATSPDLTITSSQASDVGNYRVVVTNTVDAVPSVWARLDLPLPPIIITNPATQVVGVGGPATFSVTATGSTPMNYQWYLNGSVIGGANGASFSIPFTSVAWLGSYQVQVWNSAGTNWSATAGLWLDALKMYAGVNVYGPAGSNCVVQYATNLTAPVTWMPLQSVIIVTNPTVIIDYDSPEQPKRFYRTVPQ